ncbi:phosphotransferase [Sphingomonas sanguinis]|uniref:Phosphotransferase n=1 Tax=Sphingomonas sanguinis TaxID=33051 RepID=A0ABU5LQU3_9SPHN|nr:phosphotransferase [Sphingomonas sanguinis]MDZ7282305.1 phosphotransferase [Sphingomonas sanguinis]
MSDPGGEHRVHGMGLALEAPTWPAITPDEAAAVLARFPGTTPIEALHWHSPRPFSAATLIHTTGGALLLKRHDRRVRDLVGLAEEHGFIAHLSAAGMRVPELCRTAEGASAVALGEWTYELHRRSAGDDLYRDRLSWAPFRSHDHAHAAGRSLASLHRAAQGYDAPARRVQPLVASFTILPAADPLAAAQAYVDARPALAAFLEKRPWRRPLASLFAASGDGLAPLLARQQPLWTHNDWHPSNLLWAADDTVETVFDFGLADRTCAAHDLATAIERTAFAWLELGEGRDDRIADPAAALSLIAGYDAVSPLDSLMREAVVRLLPLVHIEFALSEIDYFAGVVGDSDAAMLAWDGYLLGHADWFRSVAGRDFLAFLRAGLGLS